VEPALGSVEGKHLAVIVPMFNEEGTAERCVRTICRVLVAQVPGSKLVVVNDGSRDKTADIVRALAATDLPLTFIDYDHNQGYGAALLTGARAALKAGFEFGLYMDSDLTNDPELIPLFAQKTGEGRYDVVKASRYIRNGGMRGVPLYRQAVTIVGNRVASALFRMGVHDCTNGFRAVRLRLVANVSFSESGFPMILEELYFLKKQGARATEIPYVLTTRLAGQSKFRYSRRVVFAYLKYALKAAALPNKRAPLNGVS
jgi:dolichol-phosphate mannosyltransferase